MYRIHKKIGFLLEYIKYENKSNKMPHKIQAVINSVVNPYQLEPNVEIINKNVVFKNSFYAIYIAKIFTFLILRSFIFFRLLSYFRFSIFDTTEEALIFYRQLYSGQQNKLCLPRSLFAACTSKSFKNNGVLFIGVFFPSRAMHAWILEEGKQPDIYDDIWICYQPVAAICI